MTKKAKAATVLVTTIRDGELGKTRSYDCGDLAAANDFVDNTVLWNNSHEVGCVKIGNKIKRVF